MAPDNHDCFYVLVPVPNNQSGIDWSIEGDKMKNLVIKKMEESLLPNLRENIVEDFYLTPDYFEKELNTNTDQVFLFSQNLLNQLILDFIINQKFLMVYILLEQALILEQVCQEYYLQQRF